MKNLFIYIILLCFHLQSLAQLDIKSVSFDIQKEIPGEIHFPDSVECKMFLEAYKKSGDLDSTILWGMGCVEGFSHDTSYFKNYSISENIHIGDFNGDKKNDFIVDFSIWGCSAYSCRAYLSDVDKYSILDFRSGFLTNILFKNNKIDKVQNMILESCMYGLNLLREFEVVNDKVIYKYKLQYLYGKDSLMQTKFEERYVNVKFDSVNLFLRDSRCEMGLEGVDRPYSYKLKSKKIQVLKTEKNYCLVIIEAFNNNSYESGELKPEKYFISAWMRKEDLE